MTVSPAVPCFTGMSKALLVQKGKQNVALNEKHVLMYVLSPFIVQLFERLVLILSGVSTQGILRVTKSPHERAA